MIGTILFATRQFGEGNILRWATGQYSVYKERRWAGPMSYIGKGFSTKQVSKNLHDCWIWIGLGINIHYTALSPFSISYLTVKLARLKWVGHWLNMVEHCQTHPGGSVWAFMGPKHVTRGPQKRSKTAFFGPKWPYLAISSPSKCKWVEHWLNMVEHG